MSLSLKKSRKSCCIAKIIVSGCVESRPDFSYGMPPSEKEIPLKLAASMLNCVLPLIHFAICEAGEDTLICPPLPFAAKGVN